MNQNNADITDAELQAIHDQVDKEIAAYGLPTEEGIRRKIDTLNAAHVGSGAKLVRPQPT